MAKETETTRSHIEMLNELFSTQGVTFMLGSLITKVVLRDEDIILSDSDREFLNDVGKVFEKLVGYKIESIKNEVE